MSTRLSDAHLAGRFSNSLDRLFANLFDALPHFESNGFRMERCFPPLNSWEDDENVYAECELPGVHMEDLEITVVNRDLTLKGQRKRQEVEGAIYHRRERDVGTFHRVIHLPVDIDSGKVSAELRNGVLTVKLPKAPEAKPRKIEVKCLAK